MTAGLTSGTITATMPSSPGTQYNFIYVRNGGIISTSSLILCTSTSSDASAVEFVSTHDSKTVLETADPTLKGEIKVASDTPVPTLTHYVKVASDTPVPTLTHNVKIAPEREVLALKDTSLPPLKNMKEVRTVALSAGMKAKKYV